MQKRELELLSPAKNLEFGKIAINFGADAVYIGASDFGARKSAGNSIPDIEKLCLYAHKYHAKVFVTLNTILYEQELKQAEKLISQIYNAGADALIIQDMAILEMSIPPIALHSSTQMHNINLEKIQFYEKLGFTRAILARELSLNQIREIRANTNIELETFVHGAVCVSYSGQCYMSAFMGGRSGNRGECAQPCRLKYDLLDADKKIIEKNKHIMSLKDMNRADFLEDLIVAGIKSFKIEGRLKDLSYLKNITAFYRKKIDTILEQKSEFKMSSLGKFSFAFEPQPQKTFNRRFTDYFLTRRVSDMNSGSPKSVGEKIGQVSRKGKDFFVLSSDEVVSTGDGLCFFTEKKDLKGFSVNKVEENRIISKMADEMYKGLYVYRNNDHNFIKSLKNITNCRFIPVEIFFSETEAGFDLKINTLEKNYFVIKKIKATKQLAINRDKALANLKKQLEKTGDTIFRVSKIDINLSDVYFLPISIINKLRREALSDLYNFLGRKYIREEYSIKKNSIEYFEKNLDYKANVSNSLAYTFYKNHGVEHIDKAYEISNDKSYKTLMRTKYCLKYELGLCPKYQKPVKNIDLKYLQHGDKMFFLEFDCEKCEMLIKNLEQNS